MGHNSSRNQALLLSTQNSFSFSSFFSYKMKISYLFLILAGVIALGAVTAAREMEIVKRDIAAPEDESKSLAEDPNGEASSLAQLTRREAFDRPPIDPDGEGYPAGHPTSPLAGPPAGGSPGGSPGSHWQPWRPWETRDDRQSPTIDVGGSPGGSPGRPVFLPINPPAGHPGHPSPGGSPGGSWGGSFCGSPGGSWGGSLSG